MPRFLQPLTLLLALCALAPVAHAKDDNHDKDRAALTKAYADIDAAFNTRNVSGLAAFLADDCVILDEKGVVQAHNKKEILASGKEMLAHVKALTSHTSVTDIHFTRAGATVFSTNQSAFTETHNRQNITSTIKSANRDFWVKSGEGWLEKRAQTITFTQTVNRKPVPQDAAR